MTSLVGVAAAAIDLWYVVQKITDAQEAHRSATIGASLGHTRPTRKNAPAGPR